MLEDRIKVKNIKDRKNGRYTVDYIIFAPCFCSFLRYFITFDKRKKQPSDKEILKAILAKHGNND